MWDPRTKLKISSFDITTVPIQWHTGKLLTCRTPPHPCTTWGYRGCPAGCECTDSAAPLCYLPIISRYSVTVVWHCDTVTLWQSDYVTHLSPRCGGRPPRTDRERILLIQTIEFTYWFAGQDWHLRRIYLVTTWQPEIISLISTDLWYLPSSLL